MFILLRMALLVLCVISFYTTATGFISILGDTPDFVGYLLSAVLMVVLAIASLHLVPARLSAVPWAAGWALLYVLAAGTSVILGIGFYFSVFSAKDLGTDLFYSAYDRIYNQTRSHYRAADELTGRSEALSLLSSDLARIEETNSPNFKGTCEKSTKHGQGPAYQKRRYQQERFRQFSAEFGRVRGNLNRHLESLRSLEGSGALSVEQRLQELARLDRDFRADYGQLLASTYRTELANHARWEFAGFPEQPEFLGFAGPAKACKDARTSAQIQSVLDVVLPQLPDVTIPRFSSEDRRQVIQMVILEVARLSGIVEPAADSQPILGNRRYVMPLVIGTLIDVMILVIALIIGFTRRHGDGGHDRGQLLDLYGQVAALAVRHTGLGLEGTPVAARMPVGDAAQRLITLLDRVTVKIDRQHHLLMPEEHADDTHILSDKGVAYLNMASGLANILKKHGFLLRPTEPVTEFHGWTLIEAVRPLGLGLGDFGVNGHFRAYPLHADLYAMLVRLGGDGGEAYPSRTNLLGHLKRALSSDEFRVPPPVIARDRHYLAGEIHGRLRKRGDGWVLTLRPSPRNLDGRIAGWLSDDDDRLSEIVEELPCSTLFAGKRLYRFDLAAKRHIDALTVTTGRKDE